MKDKFTVIAEKFVPLRLRADLLSHTVEMIDQGGNVSVIRMPIPKSENH